MCDIMLLKKKGYSRVITMWVLDCRSTIWLMKLSSARWKYQVHIY